MKIEDVDYILRFFMHDESTWYYNDFYDNKRLYSKIYYYHDERFNKRNVLPQGIALTLHDVKNTHIGNKVLC